VPQVLARSRQVNVDFQELKGLCHPEMWIFFFKAEKIQSVPVLSK
jgi:hypothetical protein